MKSMKRLSLCAACVLLLLAVPAAATTAWGLRGGITFDPDQAHVGAHLDGGELFRNGVFLPNIEIGFGDDITLVTLNPELVYQFDRRSRSGWGFYVGGGLGINFWSWDDGGRGGDDSDTDLGLNALGGINKRLRGGEVFFVELKLGLADSPDAKITAGVTFF
jgi:hypothetical protein